MKYKLVIFDLDGTVLDTLDDLADSVNHVLTVNDCPVRTTDEIRTFVGNGILKLIKRSAPKDSEEELISKLYGAFVEWYKDHCLVKTAPYEGIPELIDKLREKGIKTAIVSNKGDFAVQELIRKVFPGMFDMAVGEREGIKRKPAPDSVNEVLEKLGFLKEEAVYIGDSEVDIETAGNAEMDCISVTWGFRDKEMLRMNGGSIFADNTDELYEMLV